MEVGTDDGDLNETATYSETAVPVIHSRTSHSAVRNNTSHSKVGYDDISGHKVFRVTTNQRQRNINILNKQRTGAGSKPRAHSRAPPLPNALPVTDRIKG